MLSTLEGNFKLQLVVIDKNGNVLAVLDVDSERYDVLDETDVHYLEKIAAMVADKF